MEKEFSYALYNHKDKYIIPVCYYDINDAFSDMQDKDNPQDYYVIVLANQS